MGQTYIVESPAFGDYKHITIIHVYDDGSVTYIDGASGDGDYFSASGVPDLNVNTTDSAFGDLVTLIKTQTAEEFSAGGEFGDIPKKLISEDDAVWNEILNEAQNWGEEVPEASGTHDTVYTSDVPYDPFSTNSNTAANSILERAGINIHEKNPDGTYKNLPDGSLPSDFPGSGINHSDQGGTLTIDHNEDQVFQNTGGDNTYIIEADPSDQGQTIIIEDNNTSTIDKLVIKGVDPSDVVMKRNLKGDLEVYLPGDNGTPSVVIKDQWDTNGIPRMNTVWVEPPGGGAAVPVPLNNPEDFPIDMPSPTELPPWMEDLLEDWGNAEATISPLILDLDGNGIDLAALNGIASVYWDIDNDGFRESSGWVSGNDGLLTIDVNGDGIINNHGELFGTDTTDGFTVLSAYDSNADNIINMNDAQFSDLLVWVDSNNNGYSESTELYSLTDLGISDISLNTSLVDYDIAGNHITHESTFTINGQTQTIVDAWFAYDNTNSYYSENYAYDVRTLFLPNLRGFGDVKDLHIAMNMDTTLLGMVQEIVLASSDSFFDPTFDLKGKVEALMFRWAGVENVDPLSRGEFFDARKLEFLETYLGKDFLQWGSPNPGAGASPVLEDVFVMARGQIISGVLAQTSGLFLGNDAYYNAESGAIENSHLINHLWLSAVDTNIHGSEYNDVYLLQEGTGSITAIQENFDAGHDQVWINGTAQDVGMWVDGSSNLHISMLGTTDKLEFYSAGTSAGADITSRLENIVFSDGTVLDLSQGLVLADSNDAHVNNGSALSDTIDGRGGNDYLYGRSGNDRLIGGIGNDYVNGGLGNDTFIWSVGDGFDTFYEEGGIDTIHLHGVTTDNLRFEVQGSYNLKINVGGEFLTINSQFTSNQFGSNYDFYQIEKLSLDDGSEIDLLNNLTFAGTSGADNITGLKNGNDTLIGYEGNDYLYAETGNDTLVGGTGQDYLYGSEGDDVYVYALGDGNDFISDTSGYDALSFGAGIALSDLTFTRSGNLLSIDISNGSTIQITNFYSPTSDNAVEELRFNDGSTQNLQVLVNTAPVAREDIFVGEQDVSLSGNVLVNNGNGADSDPEGNTLSVISGAYATINGSVTISSNGDFIYTSNTGFTGSDNFTYTLEDGFGGSDIGLVNLTINAPLPPNVIEGSAGTDFLYGTSASDTLLGKAGSDYLYGYEGNDIYDWSVGDGNDSINENGGLDQILLHNVLASDIRLEKSGSYNLKIHAGSETITVNNQFYSDYNNNAAYDYYQVESLLLDDGTSIDLLNNLTFSGTANADYMYGTNGDNTLYGLLGNDNLYGYGGNDTLYGGFGNDTLDAGTGNDSFNWSVGDGNDTFKEGGGLDQILLHNVLASDIRLEKSGSYNLKIHAGSETITVNNQFYSDYNNNTAYDYYQVESLLLDNGSTIDLLNNLTFTGSSSNDYLYGLNQSGVTLIGGQGNDYLYGYTQNETYEWSVGDGNDTINESGGLDQITLNDVLASDIRLEKSGSYNLKIHAGSETITVNNQFYSDYNNNTAYDYYQVESLLLDDGSTIDLLNNLTFTGSSSNDYLYGLNGSETILGLTGNDYIYARSGDDVLYGDDGSDHLYGESGNDILYGGSGIDMLYGQSGADTFVFELDSAFLNSDNIQDFKLSENDKLDISDLLIGYDPLVDAITDFVQITESGSNSYLNVDTDGGADNFVQVAYIYNHAGLTDEEALETSGNLITA